jgi:DNA-binding XRE family transcriptional regulator
MQECDNRIEALSDLWEKPLKVAAYCRAAYNGGISTPQWQYYSNVVCKHQNWTFAGVYMGQKPSERSTGCMGGLPEMIVDCKAGRIDLIITKSPSTLKRNMMDCFGLINTLLRIKPPVGIYFEDNGLCSLDNSTWFMLPILSEIAAWESKNKGQSIGGTVISYTDKLKAARLRKGMTQQDVANNAGINLRHYQMFEGGKRDLVNASFRTVMAVCKALDVNPESLSSKSEETK